MGLLELPAKSGKNANSMEYETNELGIGALADDGGEGLIDRGAMARLATAAAAAPARESKSERDRHIAMRFRKSC